MKRLRKIANDNLEFKLIEAIRNVCGSNRLSGLVSLFQEIEENYPDAIYSGQMYRKMIIPYETLNNMNHYLQDDKEYIDKEEFIQQVRDFIKIEEWQSCTYSLEACKNFYPLEDGISFIISFNGNGIDIQQLCDELYYSDDEEVSVEAEVLGKSYENEEEVVGKISKDYEIIAINNEDMKKLKSWINIEFFDQQFKEK